LKPDNPFEKSKVSERVVGLQILETSVKKLLSNATFLNATPPDVVLKQVWAPRPAFTCVGNDLATVPFGSSAAADLFGNLGSTLHPACPPLQDGLAIDELPLRYRSLLH
jgi:hypothetical protein